MSLQSEAVHHCVVMLPLDNIISKSNFILAKERLVEQVEMLAAESFPEAMKICNCELLLPGKRPPLGRAGYPNGCPDLDDRDWNICSSQALTADHRRSTYMHRSTRS